MSFKKRLLPLALATSMLFTGLVGCGNKAANDTAAAPAKEETKNR